jgi:hypothetical protein
LADISTNIVCKPVKEEPSATAAITGETRPAETRPVEQERPATTVQEPAEQQLRPAESTRGGGKRKKSKKQRLSKRKNTKRKH